MKVLSGMLRKPRRVWAKTGTKTGGLAVNGWKAYSVAMNATLLETAKKLPLAERVELAEALWEDIAAEGYEPPITPAQAAELDRRLEEHRRHPEAGVPWEQVEAGLEKKA